MDGIVIIGLLLLGGALIARSAKATAGMDDTPVSLDNIRKGIKNGWYTAELGVYNSTPCVKLTGKDKNGKDFSDYYPISSEDFIILRDVDKIPVVAHWVNE